MTERLKVEVGLLRKAGWEVETDPESQWVIVKDVPLVTGWNRSETDVLIKIPPGYATTPPDNFYTVADLRLANGSKPGSTAQEEAIAGRTWLTFSFHVEDGWDPHADPEKGHNLVTYLDAVRKRLSEAN